MIDNIYNIVYNVLVVSPHIILLTPRYDQSFLLAITGQTTEER